MNSILLGTAGFGIVTAMWGHIKSWVAKFRNLFIVRITMTDYRYTQGMMLFLSKECKPSPTACYVYDIVHWQHVPTWKDNNSKDSADQDDPLHKLPVRALPAGGTLYFHKKKFFWVNGEDPLSISFVRGMYKRESLVKMLAEYMDRFNESTENAAGVKSRDSDRYQVVHLQGSGEVHEATGGNDATKHPQVASSCLQDVAAFPASLHKCYTLFGEQQQDYSKSMPNSQEIPMALTTELDSALLEADRWREMGPWCSKRALPWKRGWLLYGVPGNGKTTFVRTVARWINCPIYVIDLASMNNEELRSAWMRIKDNQPAVALIEDIDAVFHGRKNVTDKAGNMKKGVTFDALLNVMDGVDEDYGVFTMITTNHLEKVDPALAAITKGDISTRPGRIDRLIEVTAPTEEGRQHIAKRILRDWPEDMQALVALGHNDTGAQFQERCSRHALMKYWADPVDESAGKPEADHELMNALHGMQCKGGMPGEAASALAQDVVSTGELDPLTRDAIITVSKET